MSVTTKRGVVELLTLIFYKGKGFTVEKEVGSGREKSIFISDGSVITVVQPDDKDDDRILVAVTDKDDNVSSVVIRYSKFFSELTLPASEEIVAKFYNDYQGDPQDNFWGYMFKKLSDVTAIQSNIDSAVADENNSQWKDFYAKIIIPAFYRYRDSGEVHLTQSEQDQFIKSGNFKVGSHELFPEVSKEAGSSLREDPPESVGSYNTKSKPLPEEIPKFDDEYELNSRLQERSPAGTPYAPIGDRDLHPFGQYPPLKPHLGQPEAPSSGMIPDANHPLFRGPPGSGSAPNRGDHPEGSRYDDPFGRDDFDMVGQGLPGGRGLGGGGRGTFGGQNPFGRSDGFGGGFI